jgi:hypothetical protein
MYSEAVLRVVAQRQTLPRGSCLGISSHPFFIKKPCQIFLLDRDKTKNKHYEQTLSLKKKRDVIKRMYATRLRTDAKDTTVKKYFPIQLRTKIGDFTADDAPICKTQKQTPV